MASQTLLAILLLLGAALWLLQLGSDYTDDPIFTDWRREASLLGGFALAKAVAERSGTKVLLTSGFPDPRPDDEPSANAGVRLLSKPYRKDELARALREVFDA